MRSAVSAYSAVEFDVKGDGNTYEVVLLRQSVKDYAHFRLAFPATRQWKKVTLPFHKFKQPDWGKPVEGDMVDITHLRFQRFLTFSTVFSIKVSIPA